MSKPLRFDEEAVEELDAAAVWYEARCPNLGVELVGEVRRALTAIASAPESWARDPAVNEQPVRRYVMHRFPYAVVYLELEAEIRILAIAHTRREPGFWRNRL